MARDGRGPANDPMAMMQRQIDQLHTRVRQLERKRTLTSQAYRPEDVVDPVEGEHVVNPETNAHCWFINGAWYCTSAGDYPWARIRLTEPVFVNGGQPVFFKTLDVPNYDFFEDYPASVHVREFGSNVDIQAKQDGLYLMRGRAYWVVDPVEPFNITLAGIDPDSWGSHQFYFGTRPLPSSAWDKDYAFSFHARLAVDETVIWTLDLANSDIGTAQLDVGTYFEVLYLGSATTTGQGFVDI